MQRPAFAERKLNVELPTSLPSALLTPPPTETEPLVGFACTQSSATMREAGWMVLYFDFSYVLSPGARPPLRLKELNLMAYWTLFIRLRLCVRAYGMSNVNSQAPKLSEILSGPISNYGLPHRGLAAIERDFINMGA